MGQFSVKTYGTPGSLLSANLHYYAYPSAAAAISTAAFTSYKINGSDVVPIQTMVVINSVNHIVLRSPTTLTGSITVEVT